MGLIIRLSFRNLFRQKRRNLFLGIGISFGMMILVIASSFSHGMADTLIKEIATYAYGHLVIEGIPGNKSYRVIRDFPRIERLIKETVKKEDLQYINENLSVLVRAVGNGETDNVVVVGYTPRNQVRTKEEFFYNKSLSIVDGDFREYFSKEIPYPVIITEAIAKSLNVKVHDTIRVRLPMITGQIQAAQLTVVAVIHTGNAFMNSVIFLDLNRHKELLGYKPWESSSLQLTLREPEKTANYYADQLRSKLKPGIVSIMGKVGRDNCRILVCKDTKSSRELLRAKLNILSGDSKKALGKNGVLVPQRLAAKYKLTAGKEFEYQYLTKYRGLYRAKLKVDAIYESNRWGEDVILINEGRILDTYNRFLPNQSGPAISAKMAALTPALVTEWKLLPKSKTSGELQKKYKQERRVRTNQAKYDVATMYEGASDILELESVLNLITVVAILVLFFIILIGVINTLRMTIRERTQEIGTVRAIGMQKNEVRNMFIMETFLLTAVSCAVGIVLAIVIIQILGLIRFDVNNALSMILKNKRLYFKLDFKMILSNFSLILMIAAVTAYFPARRAAKLTTVEALRHYE